MTTDDIYIKQGDMGPPLKVQLLKGRAPNEEALPLVGDVEVRFMLRALGADTAKVSALCTIDDALEGVVIYNWAAGDTDTPGTYEAEWEVTFLPDTKITCPNNRFVRVHILDDIA